MLKDLSLRSNDIEIMDDFKNPPENLEHILEDINRVNALLGGFAITVKAINKLIKQPNKEYAIIDFGCAEGSMLRSIATYCRKKNIKARFIGIDLNERTLKLAEEKSADFPEISYRKQDIFQTNTKELKCDILISTLTLHHFDNDTIIELLPRFLEIATIGIVINDLQRSVLAYYLFKLFSLIFIKTKIAKIDGLISIKRAFKKSELKAFAKLYPEAIHTIQWKWAFRYLWVLQKPEKTKFS